MLSVHQDSSPVTFSLLSSLISFCSVFDALPDCYHTINLTIVQQDQLTGLPYFGLLHHDVQHSFPSKYDIHEIVIVLQRFLFKGTTQVLPYCKCVVCNQILARTCFLSVLFILILSHLPVIQTLYCV